MSLVYLYLVNIIVLYRYTIGYAFRSVVTCPGYCSLALYLPNARPTFFDSTNGSVLWSDIVYSGVSRISARGVLKVRPDTRRGGGGGGGGVLSVSGPIRKFGGGGGVLPASGLIRKGGFDRVSGGPGYNRVHAYGYQ